MAAIQPLTNDGRAEVGASYRPVMKTIPQLEAMRILPGRAIRRLVAEGKIPSVEVGNRRYINLAVFQRYLSGGQGAEG